MAPSRRGQSSSLSVQPPSTNPVDLPPISALFLVDFDVKAGYTIAWKQAVTGLEIEGLVEYKSLPSGLHTVPDDLIYFVHDGAHAGLSAFINEPCEEEELRHARMIAVGILVPLSYGRLGRSWRHAQSLKDMASTLVKNRNKTELLEAYWHANKANDGDPKLSEPLASAALSPLNERPSKIRGRSRSVVSNSALFNPDHKLSPFHPAWSLTSLLDRFGPLIFPIHRAALLRKRILISCHAPVNQACDFVTDALPSPPPPHRLRPLFNIGVHDIPFLIEDLEASKRSRSGECVVDDDSGSGWIACTTDSILAMKDTLWDMLITMPPDYSANAKDPVWPVIECPRGQPVKATQRDLRRFNALRTGLTRLAATAAAAPGPASAPPGSQSSARLSSSQSCRAVKSKPEYATDQVVEPLSWTALAYNGFMWWASAGEQIRSEEQDEAAQDAALLIDNAAGTPTRSSSMFVPPAPSTPSSALHPDHRPDDSIASLSNRHASTEAEARIELAIIAYFHRLTVQMLNVLVDLVDATDDALPPHGDDDDGGGGGDEYDGLLPNDFEDPGANPVAVDSRSVEAMGLDVWSASDALFVQQLVALYFGRQASVDGKGIEICGVRVC
ncbi:Protein LCHN [Escovopsis weberi]|uniref:Protein LCHN n=1 Tax=Escovopsis weberi TaxID=150374 RepID=A0A0M8MV58_ESCWE|nr:Protein LCHN [Escovopsis weberi]